MVDNGYFSWDPSTPLNNGSVDSTINWVEGQLPATVNNSARSWMSRDAQQRIDMSGLNTVGGTANALTITPINVLTSYVTGMVYGIIPTADNTAAATLNVSGLGTKAIRKNVANTDVALSAGDLMRKHLHVFRYDSTANAAAGAWIVMNPASTWDSDLTFTWASGDTYALTDLTQTSTAVATGVSGASLNTFASFGKDSGGSTREFVRVVQAIGDATPANSTGAWKVRLRSNNGVQYLIQDALVIEGGTSFTGGGVVTTSPAWDTPLNLSRPSGGQVAFPATQNPSAGANTLDDYEEGTFSVTLAFATPGTSSWSYSTRDGFYTKIGNCVSFSINLLATPTIGTGSGNLNITGFPFTATGSTPLSISGMGTAWTWPAGRTFVAAAFNSGGTAITLLGMGSATSQSAFAASNMSTGVAHSFNISGSVTVT